MCIRDRTLSGEALDAAAFAALADLFKAAGSDLKIANNVTPVSYTHLRAHETVLDLVCRLLLEKKKHIPHTQITPTLRQTI